MANPKLIISEDSHGLNILTYTPTDSATDLILSSWSCNALHDQIQINDYHGNEVARIKVDSNNPIETNEGLRTTAALVRDDIRNGGSIPASFVDVAIQDQATPAVIAKFNKVTNSTTLSSDVSLNDKDIIVVSATGIIIGSYIILFNPTALRYFFATVTAINGTTITLDTPLDFAYTTGTYVDICITNMGVNGSSTTQIFGLRGIGTPPGVELSFDVTRIIFKCIASSACDLSKFGNLTKLTNGIVLRKRDGLTLNIFNVKDNGEMAGIMYDFTISSASNPAQGVNGFTGRLTFSGQEKIGVVQRLKIGEDLEFLIQDDLSGLTLFEVVAEGHIVNE